MSHADTLRKMGACEEAAVWAQTARWKHPQTLWRHCPQGDWLLWYAEELGVDRLLIVRAACACARLALPYATDGRACALRAIEAAEAWTRGEATGEDVDLAAGAVRLLTSSAEPRTASSAWAIDAAEWVADSVDGAGHSAADAAYAAALAALTAGASFRTMAKRCAREVRKIIPEVPQ